MEDIPDNFKALLAQQSAETLAAQKVIADNIYQQLEALTSLTSILPIRYPMLPTCSRKPYSTIRRRWSKI